MFANFYSNSSIITIVWDCSNKVNDFIPLLIDPVQRQYLTIDNLLFSRFRHSPGWRIKNGWNRAHLISHQTRHVKTRPFALRGQVTSFLWKWQLYDFSFKKWLVGHILNKIIVIWFYKLARFSVNESDRGRSRDKKWPSFKIMNYLFLNTNFAFKL